MLLGALVFQADTRMSFELASLIAGASNCPMLIGHPLPVYREFIVQTRARINVEVLSQSRTAFSSEADHQCPTVADPDGKRSLLGCPC